MEWPLRLAFVASLVVVWESNRPWATASISQPRAGNGNETFFTVLAGFVAMAMIVYRWYRPFTSWRLFWVPMASYALVAAIATYDWVRVANIPADSDLILWDGLQFDIKTTWGLWNTAVASYVGLAMSVLQLLMDRDSDAKRNRKGS